ncbi:unnamed protein product, partial [Anisakis simplex]|uniref:Uncharacterized protein n=1 Tax=Anisakis simplex TaxID=6269 RepID=A0A0M3KD50_ANISI
MDFTCSVNTTNDNSHTHHISPNEPQTAIRRRKSAVELRSFRSGVNRDQKRSVIGSKDDSRTSVSLFAINVFEDEALASSSSVDKNDLQLPRYHNMNLRSDNSVSPLTKCTLNAPNSQRTFASRGPTARKVHRRAATARLGSVVERSQLINPSNCDRNVSCKESGVKVRRAFSFRDLNGTMIDFTQQNSVKRWTSQVLAEIESLPSSRFDLNNLDSASTTITYQSNKSTDNSLTIPKNSCQSSDRKNID